jgi:hypothetical protein
MSKSISTPKSRSGRQLKPSPAFKAATMEPPNEDEDQQPHIKQVKRGGRRTGSQNFSNVDLDMLLKYVQTVRPVGQEQWVSVQDLYNIYAKKEGSVERIWTALRDKWNKLIRCSKPTGDPDCPEVFVSF